MFVSSRVAVTATSRSVGGRLSSRQFLNSKAASKPVTLHTPKLSSLGIQRRFTSAGVSRSSAQPIRNAEANQILASQRLKRPISPHLSIYKPQITWYGSALNRITGAFLGASLYLYFTAYLIAPSLGWNLGSQSIAAAIGALPLAAKVALKASFAFPFTFHSINGIRHLVWDTGRAMSNKLVARTGFTVVALSVLSTLYLAFV